MRGIAQGKNWLTTKRLLPDEGTDALALQETTLYCDERIYKAVQLSLCDYEVCFCHCV